jgi:hypothetical protein
MDMTKIIATTVLALVAVVCSAQDDDYKTWMKTIAATSGSLRKNVDAKAGPEAAADAEKLAGAFKDVQSYWAKNHTSDAETFAKSGHDAAMDLAKAAKAGSWDEAAADVKTITGTCGGCHTAHRERAADGFRIKP